MQQYLHNPLIHTNREVSHASSSWVRRFSCTDMKPLIVCRGPIRKEAMDVFTEMGIEGFGILISEKDSITYTHARAPELRALTDPHRIHRVPDYTGTDKPDRMERMEQIIDIARENNYDSIFAGYGFMAEDEDFVGAIEMAGLRFIGPCARTVRSAGRKDEAKRTALEVDVSVTPGVDNVTTRTLLAHYPDLASLKALAVEKNLDVAAQLFQPDGLDNLGEALLDASYVKGIDIISIEDICNQVQKEVADTFRAFPGKRVRLKAIGGGGGKGQRILDAPKNKGDVAAAAATAPGKVREILNEIKATGVGDNKNVLIELNIEHIRHQEIQLLGNGTWCISMGARDCSLQMFEQKLLEISVTREGLADAIAEAQDKPQRLASLKSDLDILRRMEEEATRFGTAVGLDSASTFECIIEGNHHFFMEMNTRIQVEHRVSELCYSLRFHNPDDPQDYFDVHSLVEAMVLLARHGKELPKPERRVRKNVAVESRLNATNAALSPHAGGLITYWSDPLPDEIRDDQGISLKNPDSGHFMRYKIAGAYDSNIALLVTHGSNRRDSYQRLAEILRRTKLSGHDLSTNLEFHYGLVHWFLGQDIYARATTHFIMPYLTQVGLLGQQAMELDLPFAFARLEKTLVAEVSAIDDPAAAELIAATIAVLERKRTLLLRPLTQLMADPHVLSGWLSRFRHDFKIDGDRVVWLVNPVSVLLETYAFLNMDFRPEAPAVEVIWKHDHELLQRAVAFYQTLTAKLEIKDFPTLANALNEAEPCPGFDADSWCEVRSAHAGFQTGLQLLGLLPLVAAKAGFFDIYVAKDLTVHIPQRLNDPELQEQVKRVLAPPPNTSADEIAAVCGGMYYPREAPGLPEFVSVGQHFEEGDPLYIIEVMKMFNTVYAPFSGTIDQILIEGEGVIVAKGQPLLKVTPDDEIIMEDKAVVQTRHRKATRAYLKSL